MEGAGHHRCVIAAAAALAVLGGCGYAQARFNDFFDLWKVEAKIGPGLQVDTQVGELIHFGVGDSSVKLATYSYGKAWSGQSLEHHFPVSLILSWAEPRWRSLHCERFEEEWPEHRCYWFFPWSLNDSTLRPTPLHAYDIEAGFVAGIAGLTFGFSLGEFFDWLIGWTTVDIGDDDLPELRSQKRLTERLKR